MKQFLRIVAMLLVLLMTVSVFVACGDKDKDIENDNKDNEKETEREQETEQQLTKEEIDQLKADMSASILEALDKMEQVTTEEETENGLLGGNGDIMEGLLGALGGLGGLGGSGSDYSQIIGDILDQYLGSDNTSDFILQLISKWFENQSGGSSWFPGKDTQDTTADQEESIPGPDSLRDFIADQTANAITDAIMGQIRDNNDNDFNNDDIQDTIYDSIYDAMMKDDNYMDGALNESFSGLGDLNGDTKDEWESMWDEIMSGISKNNPLETAERDPEDIFDGLFGGLTQ